MRSKGGVLTTKDTTQATEFSVGPYTVFVDRSQDVGSFFEVREGNKLLFQTSKKTSWLTLYEKGFAISESRGFFKTRVIKGRETGVQLLEVKQVDGDIHLLGASDLGEWSLCLQIVEDRCLKLKIKTSAARAVLRGQICGGPIFGGGTQFTHLDLRGRRFPMISQEPGIGRGVQPLTWLLNTGFGAGGSSVQSNSPVPLSSPAIGRVISSMDLRYAF